MSINEYFGDWLGVIDIIELQKIIKQLNILYKTKNITPEYEKVFKVFNLLSRHDLKAVILGQDVYPQKGVATGIAFGNNKNIDKLSPSLEVIKETIINYEIPHTHIEFDETMETWVKQGILLLNSALTCEVNKIGSHSLIWRPFISKLLYNLSNTETGIIYALLGKDAQSYEEFINQRHNKIVKDYHPAYYARNNMKMPNTIFKEISSHIYNVYGETIKWYEDKSYKE